MNVSLTPELEALVRDKVESGLYQTASEVVREGLRLLQSRDDADRQRIDELKRDILAGLRDLEQGRYADVGCDSLGAIFEDVKARGRHRVTARSGNRP